MITILMYIILAIVAIAIFSVVLPYIVLGVIIYLIYRNWGSIFEFLSGVIGVIWKLLISVIELIYYNWQIALFILGGVLVLGFFVNIIQQYKYEKILRYINKVGMCEVDDLIGKIEMSDAEIFEGLNFLAERGEIEVIYLKDTKLYKSLKNSGENYTRVELSID